MPGGRVPAGLVEHIASPLVCMRGTAVAPRRCIALSGSIGESVSCRIYDFRPEACREFAPLAALGRGDEACAEARRHHRLPPLMPVAA